MARYKHFKCGNAQRMQHSLIAERVLGRKLPPGAVVHHVDNDGLNNQNSNLVILQNNTEHLLLHAKQRIINDGGKYRERLKCRSCGEVKGWYTDFSPNNRRFVDVQNICKSCVTSKLRSSGGYAKRWRRIKELR